jgi:hypothetical protein
MDGRDFIEGSIVNGTPYMPILIKNPINNKSTIIELLVDSGAQHTIIPKEILFGLLKFQRTDSTGDIVIQGIIQKAECIAYCPEFLIDIFMSRKWLKGIRVVAFDLNQDHGILGRNILRYFNLELHFLNNLVLFKSG